MDRTSDNSRLLTFVVSIDYPNIGSRGQRVLQMCREWNAMGYASQVIIPFPLFSPMASSVSKDFEIAGTRVRWLYNSSSKLETVVKECIYQPWFGHCIQEVIDEGTCGFVLTHLDPALALTVIRHAKRSNIPVVSEYFDIVFDLEKGQDYTVMPPSRVFLRRCYFLLTNRLSNHMMKKVYKESDLLWLISSYLIEEAAQIVPRDKLVRVPAIIYNIDEKYDHDRDEVLHEYDIYDRYKITYAGDFDWHQGIGMLIEVFKSFLKLVPNAVLLLAGSGRNDMIPRMVRECGLSHAVRFLGYVSKPKLNLIYGISDCLIAPKLPNEFNDAGFSTKILDYISSGTITIASRLGEQALAFKHMEHLLFFRPGDADDLLDTMVFAYRNRKKSVEIGINGRKYVQDNFNAAKIMERPFKRLEELVMQRRSLSRVTGESRRRAAVFQLRDAKPNSITLGSDLGRA